LAESVKGPVRRSYSSPRREQQARETRRAVLAAARDGFVRDGYAATTVPQVARAAGVSAETVYKAFGSKASLAKAVFDVAVVGDDEDVPLADRDLIQRIQRDADPEHKLRLYAPHVADSAARTGPLLLVLRTAAATDAGAAAVWEQTQQERLSGMTQFAHHLAQGGHLREGVSVEEARDVLWVHNSVELWDLLVNQRGWSRRRHAQWVAQQLVAALL
jgi:AcrR family transcriptional regulator